MTPNQPTDATLNNSVEFWAKLWQQQLEKSLDMWALWAQVMPHPSARDFAAEAEAMKKRETAT